MLHKFNTIILLMIIPIISLSQSPDKLKDVENQLREKAEKTYGLDDRLVNGLFYQDKHPKARRHPYFMNEQWQKGSVYIHDIEYNNLLLKYNIAREEIILNYRFKGNNNIQLLLNNNIIDSVRMNTHLFINARNIQVDDLNGYFELVYRGNFKAYKKYNKTFIDTKDKQDPYGTYFYKKDQIYILKGNGEFLKVNTKSALIKEFNSLKKQIRKYIRQNKLSFKSMNQNQLYNLLRFCDEKLN